MILFHMESPVFHTTFIVQMNITMRLAFILDIPDTIAAPIINITKYNNENKVLYNHFARAQIDK